MSQSPNEPEHLLASLLSDEQQAAAKAEERDPDGEEDVDGLIDELEALVSGGRRRLLGRKLVLDEEPLLQIIDRLRTAVPAEVRQAHRVLDEHDRIIEVAQAHARRMMEERGLLEAVENERRRVLEEAEREAERIRMEADRYARSVLVDLDERLARLHTSVRNGIEALQGGESRVS